MSPNRIQAEYDDEADALYVRFAPASPSAVSRSVILDDFHVVDADAAGRILGFEVLSPTRHLDLAGLAYRFGFAERLREIEQAIEVAVPGLRIPPTYSLALSLYQLSIASTAFETGSVIPTGTTRTARSYKFIDELVEA
jgi:uncharacterized protein YuzE